MIIIDFSLKFFLNNFRNVIHNLIMCPKIIDKIMNYITEKKNFITFGLWVRTRLLAWARSSPKDFLPHSFKTVRLQVALGHPLDLFPCGFHSKALWQISFSVFRRVCPIQPYFLLFISTFISDCPVLSHSFWLEIISGHQIPSMFRRHLLTPTTVLSRNPKLSTWWLKIGSFYALPFPEIIFLY